MDCPEFVPNIFNRSRCSQCFKMREEHFNPPPVEDSSERSLSSASLIRNSGKRVMKTGISIRGSEKRSLLNCGHLFIAPTDYNPHDPNYKNKRWQRRWFAFYDDGELAYSIDEHPDATPQGKINLKEVSEMSSGEGMTGHQYSIFLKSLDRTSHYIKSSNVDEYRKWIRVLETYSRGNDGAKGAGTSSSCASSISGKSEETDFQVIKDQKVLLLKSRVRRIVAPYQLTPVSTAGKNSADTKASNASAPNLDSGFSSHYSAPSQPSDSDGSQKELKKGKKGAYCDAEMWGIANGSPSPGVSKSQDVNESLRNLKSRLLLKRSELEALNKSQIVKSDKLFIENLKLQLNSYFIEIDKLSHSINHKFKELKDELKCKDSDLAQLQWTLEEADGIKLKNEFLTHENELLVDRINDLTEKYYKLEKTYKVVKTKLHRCRTSSLKEKDLVEKEISTKILQLEQKISRHLPLAADGISPTLPTIEEKQSLVNVIQRLNKLDKQLDAGAPSTEWYKCSNCDYLQSEIFNRDSKLNELESMVESLEDNISSGNKTKIKYNEEIEELRSFYSESVQTIDSAYKRLVAEIQQTHQTQLQNFEMMKEAELEEESRATKQAFELLKKNYVLELESEKTSLREDYLVKYNNLTTTLEVMNIAHEQETNELRDQLLNLTEKYSKKCLENSELAEKVSRSSFK